MYSIFILLIKGENSNCVILRLFIDLIKLSHSILFYIHSDEMDNAGLVYCNNLAITIKCSDQFILVITAFDCMYNRTLS